jgi:hypothetical protein
MKKKKWDVISIVLVVLSLAATICAFALGGCSSCVETAAGGCVPMKCHWTFIAVGLIQIMAIAAAGMGFTTPGVHGRRVCTAMVALVNVIGLFAFYGPLMGLCASGDMPCHMHALVVSALQIISLVVAIYAFFACSPSQKKPKKEM